MSNYNLETGAPIVTSRNHWSRNHWDAPRADWTTYDAAEMKRRKARKRRVFSLNPKHGNPKQRKAK